MSKKPPSTEEVLQGIFSGNGPKFEGFPSDSLTESSFEEEVGNIAVAPPTLPVRKTGPQTRDRLWRAFIDSSKKQLEEEWLEEVCKQKDSTSIISEFTASKINAELSDDPDTIDFIDLFLNDEFFNLLATQTNLYAAQYMQVNLELPPPLRFKIWKDVSIEKMRAFISLYMLTGIVLKHELNQYWSGNPLMKTSFFNEAMPQNRFQLILEFLHFNGNV